MEFDDIIRKIIPGFGQITFKSLPFRPLVIIERCDSGKYRFELKWILESKSGIISIVNHEEVNNEEEITSEVFDTQDEAFEAGMNFCEEKYLGKINEKSDIG